MAWTAVLQCDKKADEDDSIKVMLGWKLARWAAMLTQHSSVPSHFYVPSTELSQTTVPEFEKTFFLNLRKTNQNYKVKPHAQLNSLTWLSYL